MRSNSDHTNLSTTDYIVVTLLVLLYLFLSVFVLGKGTVSTLELVGIVLAVPVTVFMLKNIN